jgi:hypothetical protein
MVKFAALLLRGVIATFAGLLIAGGTLTLAADRATVQRPTLVPVPAAPATLKVPAVSGQAYVFAKGILQDRGFAWHVTGRVRGYAANTVLSQQPAAGTTVLDTGAPTITLTLMRNPSYLERGTPENDAPYAGTAIRLPAQVPPRPQTTATPRLEPLPVPDSPAVPTLTLPVAPVTTTPAVAPTRPVTPVTKAPSVTPPPARPTTPKVSAVSRAPDYAVPGAPKEPAKSQSLPDRVAALATWIENHRDPSAANLNHWLYEHAYVVAGARFGWWHGAEALQALISVDKRAEVVWGVGSQSRTTAEKALAEVRSRSS